MTKISDTQAIILSAAAQREDRIALPLPDSLRGGAATKVVGAMLAKGFLQEVDADTRTAERIRDKVRASRMKGMWMGGHVPLGYDVKDRKLVVNEEEAATVRGIFERFVEVGSATVLARELRRKGLRNKQGTLVDKGYLYRVLVNRVYRGEAVHKGKAYPGEHQPIIDEQLWDQVHAILRQNPRKRANNTRAQAPALLKGLIFTATGAAMTPSSTKKGARRYRYYVSMDVIKNREPSDEGIPRRLPADLVEAAVVTELRRVMRAPSITAQVIAHLAREGLAFAEADVISALQTFDDVWGQLFPAEQTRIVQLLVRRVTVTFEGLVIDVRTDGVSGVMRDMMAPRKKVAAE